METKTFISFPQIEPDNRIVFLLAEASDTWLFKLLNRKQRRIRQKFHYYGLKLVCLPFLKDGYQISIGAITKLMQYQYPALYSVSENDLNTEIKQLFYSLDESGFNNLIISKLGTQDISTPCLLRCKSFNAETGEAEIEHTLLTPARKRKCIRFFDWFAEKSIKSVIGADKILHTDTGILFHAQSHTELCMSLEEEDKAMEDFFEAMKSVENSPMMAQLFLNMIHSIKDKGTDLYPALKNIFESIYNPEPKPLLSKVMVDRHYKVFLPEFGNIEVKMTPLPKTLYLFFLKHPEGIRIVNLPDFREEIVSIYYGLSGRDDKQQIEKSVDELISPIGNSIHEKMSRVRNAFKCIMDDSTARYYYISGERGSTYKIELPREFIDLKF